MATEPTLPRTLAEPPRTLAGMALLGWMDRAAAVKFLRDDCVFDHQLTEEEAEQRWLEYRRRAEALPEREALAPQPVALTPAEKSHADRFLAFLRQRGVRDVQRIVKVDPFRLIAHQYVVVTERCEEYRLRCTNAAAWIEECLPTVLTNPQVRVSFSQQHLNTAADIDLPHGEFFFGLNPNGMFGPAQALRYVTVANVGRRMLLWAGYHRSYARMLSTTPMAADRFALFALTTNTLAPPPPNAAGVTGPGEGAGLGIFGRRPCLLADFFTDGLLMRVNLRRKRYQLQVRSTWVALDDTN